MHASDLNFTRFIAAIDTLPLPERFTFPFCYTPHPLCILAAQELQQHIETQHQWQHNFGLNNDDDTIGHMFGVLLVQNQQGELGYLSAFSGKVANQTHLPHFVPPVFDERNIDPTIKDQQTLVDIVTTKITAIKSNPNYIQLQQQYQQAQSQAELASESFRLQMIEQRKQRKLQRTAAEKSNDSEFMTQEFHRLARESAFDKHQQKSIRQQWTQTLTDISDKLQADTAELALLKSEYDSLTAALQQQRYAQYQFLNQYGETKDLNDLFGDIAPPQGAGDCATIKLLQHAFKQHLKPLAMAKFWWGASPAAQIRKHKYFYEACKNKCEPILQHMLTGLNIDANPLLQNPAEGKELEIVYQDNAMVVINKPAEFLSVPGKTITDSVYSRMQAMFPNSDSPLIVHRLDMSTSGLIVIALTKYAHKALQKQFINRTAEKRYVALLDGIAKQDHGEIDLPMRVDLDDRPRQLVCYEHGKPALTKWQVIERKNGKTKVYYYPKTGRTHQLRIHSAHQNGMNMPIVGDDLYGQKANRLHLHAQYLGLTHPVSGEPMIFEVDADF
ncbi:RluA family pseudouridine synthase [Photobacterium toruni]|uniref:RluA family pseudouridine synthase n=1 Tax=Photobacterium toruni TaxID=1935446 RepID=UPI002E172DA6|nr:RluA family pseudouridine synthase [Photobacterium toruni]